MAGVSAKPIVLKCLLAVVGVAIATGLQWVTWRWVGPSRFLYYYPAIIFTSLYGGWLTGVVATILGMIAAEYFFFSPTFTFGPFWSKDLPPLSIFVLSGLLISFLSARIQKRRGKQERLKLMDALEHEKVKFEAILEQAVESVFVLDEEGRIQFANRETEKVFGFTASEFIGRDLHSLTHHHYPDGRTFPRSECRMAYAYIHGEVLRAFEETLIRKDGSFVNVSYSNAPFLIHGKKVGSILLATDITERKKMEADLRKALKTAEEAVRDRDEFLSVASHELKTPLTSLKLQNQLRRRSLTRQDMDSFSPENLDRMLTTDDQQVDRLIRLVEDMLDVSRINVARVSIQKERLNLCAVTQEVVEQFSEVAQEAGCIVTVQMCESAIGEWDKFRIEQILFNLISNAIKYGNRSPISVLVQRIGSFAELTVRDKGRGIRKDDQERIFQRFERAVKTGTVSGLGLGLYIVRQLVELHGGSISVESEPGEGATFIVKLPLSNTEESHHA